MLQEVLHCGEIDNCKLTHGLDSYISGEVFNMIVHNNDTDYNTASNISSDPLQICSCEHNFTDYSFPFPCTVYPGETLFWWLQLDKEMEQFLAE